MRDRFALWTALAAALAVSGAWFASGHLPAVRLPPPPPEATDGPAPLVPEPYHLAPALAADTLPPACEALKPLYRVKGRPAPDEWLAVFPELGETWAAYTKSEITRPTAARRTIHLVGLGALSEAQGRLVDATAEYLAAYLGMLVVVDAPLPASVVRARATLPGKGFGPHWLTSEVLENVLVPRLPEDALVFVAFTANDLTSGADWNYVFGEATFEKRVAVFSLARFGNPAASPEAFRKALERTWKTASHELGHAFTIPHCVAYECVMNGRLSLDETDLSPLAPCPVCLAKLSFALGTRPVDRLAACAEIARKYGLSDAAARFGSLAAASDAASAHRIYGNGTCGGGPCTPGGSRGPR